MQPEPLAGGGRTPFRAGFVAIIGRANVGKSTLLNELLGQKLSAVSPKPHTTRHKLLGVLHGDHYQAALLDTPGYLTRERDELDVAMSRQGAAALAEADLVVLVVEPRPPGDVERRFMAQIERLGHPALLAVNKIDRVAKTKLLPVMAAYAEVQSFVEIMPVSALRRDGLEILVQHIAMSLPEGAPLFPAEMLTDRSLQFRIGEVVREKVFHLYGQEVPYYVAVEVQEHSEREGGRADYVAVTIYVDKPSQRRLLVGEGGRALKEVGVRARQEMEVLVGRSVYLDLWVKVSPQWRRKVGFVGSQL